MIYDRINKKYGTKERIEFKFQYDFASGNPPNLKDAFIGLRGLDLPFLPRDDLIHVGADYTRRNAEKDGTLRFLERRGAPGPSVRRHG